MTSRKDVLEAARVLLTVAAESNSDIVHLECRSDGDCEPDWIVLAVTGAENAAAVRALVLALERGGREGPQA